MMNIQEEEEIEDYSMDDYTDEEEDEAELEVMKRLMKPNGLFRNGNESASVYLYTAKK